MSMNNFKGVVGGVGLHLAAVGNQQADVDRFVLPCEDAGLECVRSVLLTGSPELIERYFVRLGASRSRFVPVPVGAVAVEDVQVELCSDRERCERPFLRARLRYRLNTGQVATVRLACTAVGAITYCGPDAYRPGENTQ